MTISPKVHIMKSQMSGMIFLLQRRQTAWVDEAERHANAWLSACYFDMRE